MQTGQAIDTAISLSQVFLAVLSAVAAAGGAWAVIRYRVKRIEEDVVKLRDDLEKAQADASRQRADFDSKIIEVTQAQAQSLQQFYSRLEERMAARDAELREFHESIKRDVAEMGRTMTGTIEDLRKTVGDLRVAVAELRARTGE